MTRDPDVTGQTDGEGGAAPFDLVVTSPGWPPHQPFLAAAAAAGLRRANSACSASGPSSAARSRSPMPTPC